MTAGWHNPSRDKKYAEVIRPTLTTLMAQGQIQNLNPKEIDSNERERYMEFFLPIARNCFSKHMDYDDVYKHVFNADTLSVLSTIGGNPIGFSSVDYFTVGRDTILYMSGTMVDPSQQRNHLYAALKLNSLENAKHRYDYVATRTQNPIVYGTIAKFMPVMPNVTSTYFEAPYGDIAQKLGMGSLRPGEVAKSLYDTIPKHSDSRVQSFFDNTLQLNAYKGDALLIVGKYENNNSRERSANNSNSCVLAR